MSYRIIHCNRRGCLFYRTEVIFIPISQNPKFAGTTWTFNKEGREWSSSLSRGLL